MTGFSAQPADLKRVAYEYVEPAAGNFDELASKLEYVGTSTGSVFGGQLGCDEVAATCERLVSQVKADVSTFAETLRALQAGLVLVANVYLAADGQPVE